MSGNLNTGNVTDYQPYGYSFQQTTTDPYTMTSITSQSFNGPRFEYAGGTYTYVNDYNIGFCGNKIKTPRDQVMYGVF